MIDAAGWLRLENAVGCPVPDTTRAALTSIIETYRTDQKATAAAKRAAKRIALVGVTNALNAVGVSVVASKDIGNDWDAAPFLKFIKALGELVPAFKLSHGTAGALAKEVRLARTEAVERDIFDSAMGDTERD